MEEFRKLWCWRSNLVAYILTFRQKEEVWDTGWGLSIYETSKFISTVTHFTQQGRTYSNKATPANSAISILFSVKPPHHIWLLPYTKYRYHQCFLNYLSRVINIYWSYIYQTVYCRQVKKHIHYLISLQDSVQKHIVNGFSGTFLIPHLLHLWSHRRFECRYLFRWTPKLMTYIYFKADINYKM